MDKFLGLDVSDINFPSELSDIQPFGISYPGEEPDGVDGMYLHFYEKSSHSVRVYEINVDGNKLIPIIEQNLKEKPLEAWYEYVPHKGHTWKFRLPLSRVNTKNKNSEIKISSKDIFGDWPLTK